MLIAEDLLLLVTDDARGDLAVPAMRVDAGLGGATLAELALLGKVDVSGGGVVVRDRETTGDDILDEALAIVAGHEGRKAAALVRPLSKDLRPRLYQRLVDAGVLSADARRLLGVVPRRRWPARDTRHEAEVRQTLTAVLARGAPPDERTAALVALLHALGCEDTVVDPARSGLSKRELRDRAERIAAGDWAGEAVRRAIAAIVAAVVASTSTTVLS